MRAAKRPRVAPADRLRIVAAVRSLAGTSTYEQFGNKIDYSRTLAAAVLRGDRHPSERFIRHCEREFGVLKCTELRESWDAAQSPKDPRSARTERPVSTAARWPTMRHLPDVFVVRRGIERPLPLVDLGATPPEVGGPYEILDCENLRRVSGRGFIYEDLAGRTIRATSESVSHYRFGFQNPGVRFQRLRIEPLSGCDVEQVAAMGHHFVETLRLIPPLGTKEILRFRVAHRLFKMSGTPQPFTSNIFRSRVHRLLDRVAFPLQHLPARVWWYGDVPPEDRPAAWQKLRELEVDSLGIVEAEFRAIRRNRAYGIAWEW